MTAIAKPDPRRSILPGALAVALLASAPAFAQDPAPAAAAAPVEEITLDQAQTVTPAAQAEMDRMTAALQALNRFSLTAEVSRDEVLPYGYKLQHMETATMLVDRPDKMRVEVEGDIKDRTYVYDGSTLTIYAPGLNVYGTAAVKGTLGELTDRLLDRGVEMPLIDMLYNGTAGNLLEDVRVGLVVGESAVDGVPVTQLAFRQADVDWQIWIAKDGGLPRKLVITTRFEVGDPQYQAVLRWNTAPRIAANAFNFVPPSGAVKIKSDLADATASTGGDK